MVHLYIYTASYLSFCHEMYIYVSNEDELCMHEVAENA